MSLTTKSPLRAVVLGKSGFVAGAVIRHLEAAGVPVRAFSAKDLDLCSEGAGAALAAELKPTDALIFISALTPDRGKDLATMRKNLLMA